MTVALFYGLIACLDASSAMFRRIAGRNALIKKRALFLRFAARGLIAGLLADVFAIAWLLVLPDSAHSHLVHAGRNALWVAVPTFGIFAMGSVLRSVRSLEFRTLSSAVLFGPLTFIRPHAIALCAAVAAISDRDPLVTVTVALFVLMIVWWTRAPWPVVSSREVREHHHWRYEFAN
jgi:hypothetical protein